MAITRDQIWQVADDLDAEGIKPTLAAVRKKVGGGSYTTIQEAMSEWKSRRQQAARPISDPPPPELAERVAALSAEIWTLARAAADTALAGERQQMEAERAKLRAQAAEAVEVADSLTEDNDRMKAELVELAPLRQDHERTLADLAELKRESGEEIKRAMEKASQKDSEAIEARKSERAALDRAANLEGQVTALKGQLEQMEAERAELRAQAAEAVEAADRLTEDNDRMKAELVELAPLRQDHERTLADLAELKRKSGEEINRTMEKANRKDSEAIEARKSERAALDRAANLEGQVTALKGQLADLTATLKPRTGGRQ